MPKSTASGCFANDGANEPEVRGHIPGDGSDLGSVSALLSGLATDQGPSLPLFPPSIIAPFTTGQQISLLKLFCQDQNITLIYTSTEE